MMNRRNFLAKSAATLPVLALAGPRAWAAKHHPLGLQLYTIRSLIGTQGLPSLLKQVRAIGYEEVEAFGDMYKPPAAELRATIRDAGLRVPSAHFGYDDLGGHLDYAKQLGVSWAVCSMISHSLWNEAGFHTAAKQFNEWGKQAKDRGLRFAFHNHAYEFTKYSGGKTGYDILLDETDPELVSFEIDCYWVAQAGHDPLTLLKRLGKRARMLHLKDRKPGFPTTTDMSKDVAHFTEVGKGTIQWKPLLAEAQRLDVEHYFVEEDKVDGDPIAAIRSSYNYLRTILS